jgi:acyl-ACP thioesterase
MEAVGERTIVYSDLDFNRHMNNTRYPDMICDFLPSMDGKWVTSLSLSYLREAAFGDTLTVHRKAVEGAEDTFLIRTTRPDGLVCLEAEIGLATI